MEVIPALDLLDGRVVRLTRGDLRHTKVYDRAGDPLAIARMWVDEGAKTLHIIDLSGAFSRGNNRELILGIANSLEARVQVGGGIRDLKTAEALLDGGVHRVILGTMAFKEPNSLVRLLDNYGERRVAVALDYGERGQVMVGGWTTQTGRGVVEAMDFFKGFGVKFYLLTAIERDGTLRGSDRETIERVISIEEEVNIMASGGINGLEDISALKKTGVYGVILGKALYEGKINLREALKIAQGGE